MDADQKIAQDRAWLRQHGQVQRVASRAQAESQARRERDERERTCWFCFHSCHVLDYGGSLVDLAVLWCSDPACLCGVPPCPGCDERVRPTVLSNGMMECPFCHHEQYMPAYA